MPPDRTIEQEVVIDAPVEVVWRTVTEPDQITRWWSDRADVRAVRGETGSVSFEHDDGTVVGSSRVDLQACKLEYCIVSPK